MPYVVYAMSHTYLTRCLHHVPSEAMMSDVLGTHEYAWGPSATGHVVAPEPSGTGAGPEPQDTCQYRSPVERWSLNLGHVATPEPSCVGGGPGATRCVATPEPSPTG
jgi:hypothetical protein